jgi:hypothetical protein
MRLADIKTSASGEGFYMARDHLKDLIEGKIVRENVGGQDTDGKWWCVTFVLWNMTHFLNVNKYMVVNGFANETDYPNDFSPSEWRLYVPKDSMTGLPTIPEFPSFLILPLFMTASLIAVEIYKRKRFVSFPK